jgi:hypothetical protein
MPTTAEQLPPFGEQTAMIAQMPIEGGAAKPGAAPCRERAGCIAHHGDAGSMVMLPALCLDDPLIA